MSSDEAQIRQLVDTWMTATRHGDLQTLMGLMTDDVVFLMPGRQPMYQAEFAAASQPQPQANRPHFEARTDIQELQVLGDWAFMWSHLTVRVTAPGGAKPVERAGHTLTLFHKQHGQWRLARDANMLATVPGPTA